MAQGRKRQVINIGLGIKQLCVEPRSVSVATYAESLAHKVPFAFSLFEFHTAYR